MAPGLFNAGDLFRFGRFYNFDPSLILPVIYRAPGIELIAPEKLAFSLSEMGLRAELLKGKNIRFKDLLTVTPVTHYSQYILRINYNTVAKRFLDPIQFTVTDIWKLAKHYDLEPAIFLNLIYSQYPKLKKLVSGIGVAKDFPLSMNGLD